MKFLTEGESIFVQGSGKKPYEIKMIGGVVSCSCPSWRNLGKSIDQRVCKHIKAQIDPNCLLPQAQANVTPASPVNPSKIPKTEPDLLLAHNWAPDIDPTGYWMSEKLDGLRALWDGQNFISRLGNIYHAPEWFKGEMPHMVLDGELWIGRKKFPEIVSTCKKIIPNDLEWNLVHYMVFDAPELTLPFEDRQEYLKSVVIETDHIEVLQQIPCESPKALEHLLKTIESLNGEGVMLRQPGSLYTAGRSTTLLKVKTFHDAEAQVIGHIPGKGKHKGRMGAILVRMPNQIEFEIGSGFSDQEREHPPAIGTTITYKYQELNRDGRPRFGTFLRIKEE